MTTVLKMDYQNQYDTVMPVENQQIVVSLTIGAGDKKCSSYPKTLQS